MSASRAPLKQARIGVWTFGADNILTKIDHLAFPICRVTALYDVRFDERIRHFIHALPAPIHVQIRGPAFNELPITHCVYQKLGRTGAAPCVESLRNSTTSIDP